MIAAHRDCSEPPKPAARRPVTLTLTIHADTVGWAKVALRGIGELASSGMLDGIRNVTHTNYHADLTVGDATP